MSRHLPVWLRRDINEYENPNTRRGYRYRKQLIYATPPWISQAQRDAMRRLRAAARRRGLEVDHIVPINSPLVCGLNVPWNLQALPPAANRAKSNHMWPGHPYENRELLDVRSDPHQLRLEI